MADLKELAEKAWNGELDTVFEHHPVHTFYAGSCELAPDLLGMKGLAGSFVIDSGDGLVMLDVDYFKSYNDTYGHQSGDRILQTVANSLKNFLRKSDEVFRYGGEEIVAILAGTNIMETMWTAEKIRKGIEELGIEHKGNPLAGVVTVSCGVSAYCAAEQGTKEWEDVLEEADKALYKAKAKGRNRVYSLAFPSLEGV